MWRTLAPNPVRYSSFLSFSRGGGAYPKDWMQSPVNIPPFPLFLSGMRGGSQRESWGSRDLKSADIFFIKDGIAVGIHSIQYTLFGNFVE